MLEAQLQCGESGYPLDFGFIYCKRFKGCFPAVESWIHHNLACLKK